MDSLTPILSPRPLFCQPHATCTVLPAHCEKYKVNGSCSDCQRQTTEDDCESEGTKRKKVAINNNNNMKKELTDGKQRKTERRQDSPSSMIKYQRRDFKRDAFGPILPSSHPPILPTRQMTRVCCTPCTCEASIFQRESWSITRGMSPAGNATRSTLDEDDDASIDGLLCIKGS